MGSDLDFPNVTEPGYKNVTAENRRPPGKGNSSSNPRKYDGGPRKLQKKGGGSVQVFEDHQDFAAADEAELRAGDGLEGCRVFPQPSSLVLQLRVLPLQAREGF